MNNNISTIKKLYPELCKNLSDKDIQTFVDAIFFTSDILFSDITKKYLLQKQSSFISKENQYTACMVS